MKVIRIAAAVILRNDGSTLLVRKRGARAFMQPGGKIDPGESPADALVRELEEEIGIRIRTDEFRSLGYFEAPAANEPGHLVSAEVFILHIGDTPVTRAAEIEEIRWVSPDRPGDIVLAELTGRHILPAWLQMRDSLPV